jgi:hypothetical protein
MGRFDHTQAKFHEAFDNCMEDVEEDVQVLKRDISDVEQSVDNTHLWLEKVEDGVDGFVSALCNQTGAVATSACVAFLEAQHVEKGLQPIVEGWFGKLEWNNTIIDKWFVWMEEDYKKVCNWLEERLRLKFEEVRVAFAEADESLLAQYEGMAAKVVDLEESLLQLRTGHFA